VKHRVSEEEEIEALRQKKMMELQRKLAKEEQRLQVQQQVEIQKQTLLRRILSPEARQRLTNLKMVKPEFAEQIELQLIQLAQAGRLSIPVTDDQLKEILVRLQSQRRDIKIRRK
jgi:programmed cell death protein 5